MQRPPLQRRFLTASICVVSFVAACCFATLPAIGAPPQLSQEVHELPVGRANDGLVTPALNGSHAVIFPPTSHERIPESVWQSPIVTPIHLGSPTQTANRVPEEPNDSNLDTSHSDQQVRRRRLASQVSQSILNPQSILTPQLPLSRSTPAAPSRPTHVATSANSESVTVEIQVRAAIDLIAKAERLFDRGAFYGARQQAREALTHFAMAADVARSRSEATQSRVRQTENISAIALIQEAFQAIREAGDFVGRFGIVDTDACRRMVLSHQTPLLKSDATVVSGHTAADLYLDLARQRFVQSLGEYPQARHALALLGRSEAKCEENPEGLRQGILLCCLRSAISLAPSDANLLSEFGQTCLRTGLDDEGCWALQRAVTLARHPTAAATLLNHYRSTNNDRAILWLRSQTVLDANQAANPDQTIFLVNPEQFATISPPVQSAPRALHDMHQQHASEPSPAGRVPTAFSRHTLSGGHATSGRNIWAGAAATRSLPPNPSGDWDAVGKPRGFWERVAGQTRLIFR